MNRPRIPLSVFPWLLLLLEALHFLLRWQLCHSPFFSELDYDEGIIGLMAFHILRGDPQMMIWGLPRLGGFEAYLASFLFYVFGPSSLTIQISLILVSSVLLLVIYAIGKKVGGPLTGILAASFWALPPIFLSFTGNYVTGGHLEAVLAGAFLLYGISRTDLFSSTKAPFLLALMGILSGLGWWSSLLIFPFILAVTVGMVGSALRFLISRSAGLGIGGFFLGSLPFWTWNYYHDFNTFLHLGGKSFLDIAHHIIVVVMTIIPTLIGVYWDGQSVVSLLPKPFPYIILIGFYLPILIISLGIAFLWLKRIVSKQFPFQRPIDYLVLTFWAYIIIRATGETEDLGKTRYTIAFFVSLSVLVSYWIEKIFRMQKTAGILFIVGLLGFNLYTNFLFLKADSNNPVRPTQKLINLLDSLHIHFCYAHHRLAHVVTFESKEKIITSDFYGWRNYGYLKKVDSSPGRETAILTHRKLGSPFPEVMEETLQCLGCQYEKKEVGDYVVFYGFKEPEGNLKSLPAKNWRITTSHDFGQRAMIIDRDILTDWQIPKAAGEWLKVDLGRVIKVGQVTLFSGLENPSLPDHFRLDISKDGLAWTTLREANNYLSGLYWFRGRPRLDLTPRLQLIFPPRECRYIRIMNLKPTDNSSESWRLAELFIYESLPHPEDRTKQITNILNQAQEHLAHWMDDPTGPQSSNLNIKLTFRKKQVDWNMFFPLISRVIQQDPDWEEPHRLLGQALTWGEFWDSDRRQFKKAGSDPKTIFPRNEFGEIPPKNWKAFSNANNRETQSAIDGDLSTRWASLKNQMPGVFFMVDLGKSFSINGFSLFLAGSFFDYPRGLSVFTSLDGLQWKNNAFSSSVDYAFDQNQMFKKVDYRITPVEARFLKLEETGQDPVHWWSIYELAVSKTD